MEPVSTSSTSQEIQLSFRKQKETRTALLVVVVALVFFVIGILFQKYSLTKSDSPYQNVNLMPFKPDGWYKNGPQVQKLINETNVAVIIEVGSWMGKSTLHMASLIPQNGKVYAIDTWKGEPTQVFKYDPELLRTLYDQFLSNVIHANLTTKIVPVRMTSEQAAHQLNVFPHLIYIDATHNYQQAKKDLNLWYPFIKGHGVICGDDYSWGDGGVGVAVQQFAKQNNLKSYNDGTFWKLFKE